MSSENSYRQREVAAWRQNYRDEISSLRAVVRTPRVELTPKQVARIRSDLKDGISMAVIAKSFGCRPCTLRQKLEAAP